MTLHRRLAYFALIGACSTLASAQPEYTAYIIEPWDTNYALAVSRASGINNHNTVTGCATPLSGNCSFLWTLDGGKEQVNLGGVINDNGWIIASGFYGVWSPERAVVLVPLSACPADFNDDGDLNTLDVLAFLNAWNADDPAADFNDDGTVDTLDVLAFLNAWNGGC